MQKKMTSDQKVEIRAALLRRLHTIYDNNDDPSVISTEYVNMFGDFCTMEPSIFYYIEGAQEALWSQLWKSRMV